MWQAVHITSPPPFFSMITSGCGTEFGIVRIAVAQCLHTGTHRDMLHPLVSPSCIRIYSAFMEKEIKREGEKQGEVLLVYLYKQKWKHLLFTKYLWLSSSLIRNLSHFLFKKSGPSNLVGCYNTSQTDEKHILLFSDTFSVVCLLVSPNPFWFFFLSRKGGKHEDGPSFME